jgi:hypothetical protein
MDNCFEWYSSECSPESFPTEIVEGFFVLYNGIKHQILTNQHSQNGWGVLGSEFYLGTDIKPVPAFLILRYISFVERKVYAGEVLFDKDVLIPLFKKPIISPINNNERMHYNRIVVGTAPQGYVSVWLQGDTNSEEVLQFQCKEDVDFNIADHYAGYKDLNDYCERNLREKSPKVFKSFPKTPSTPLPTKWFDLYRKPISLPLEFHLLGELTNFQVWFYNGESTYQFPAKKQQPLTLQRMPEKVVVNWVKDNGDSVMNVIAFDQDSIFSAYDQLAAVDITIRLVIQLREHDDSIRAWFKSKNRTIEIPSQL